MNFMNQLDASHVLLMGLGIGSVTFLFIIIALWSLVWKGFALWYAARNHQKKWFVAILILNTVGILEIIYLFGFRRDKQPGVTKSLFNNPLPSSEEKEEEVAESKPA